MVDSLGFLEGVRAKKGCYDSKNGGVRVLMNIAVHLLVSSKCGKSVEDCA
jgi:hypothetical protein